MTYLYIMHDQKQLNEAIILEHVHHLKQLKKEERLVLMNYPPCQGHE